MGSAGPSRSIQSCARDPALTQTHPKLYTYLYGTACSSAWLWLAHLTRGMRLVGCGKGRRTTTGRQPILRWSSSAWPAQRSAARRREHVEPPRLPFLAACSSGRLPLAPKAPPCPQAAPRPASLPPRMRSCLPSRPPLPLLPQPCGAKFAPAAPPRPAPAPAPVPARPRRADLGAAGAWRTRRAVRGPTGCAQWRCRAAQGPGSTPTPGCWCSGTRCQTCRWPCESGGGARTRVSAPRSLVGDTPEGVSTGSAPEWAQALLS